MLSSAQGPRQAHQTVALLYAATKLLWDHRQCGERVADEQTEKEESKDGDLDKEKVFNDEKIWKEALFQGR